jgi:hypothetical protein
VNSTNDSPHSKRNDALERLRDENPEFNLKYLEFQRGNTFARVWGPHATALVAVFSMFLNLLQFNHQKLRDTQTSQHDSDQFSAQKAQFNAENDLRHDEVGIATMQFYLQNKATYESGTAQFRIAVLNAVKNVFSDQRGVTLLMLFDALKPNLTPEERRAGEDAAAAVVAEVSKADTASGGRARVLILTPRNDSSTFSDLNLLRRTLDSTKRFEGAAPRVMPFAPNNTEVRYYYPEDRVAAESASAVVTRVLNTSAQAKAVFERASTHRQHVLELWIGLGYRAK